MNTNLLNIVNRIVAEQGEGILGEPRRVSAFFADLAKDEPKPQKNAFVKCLEHESAQLLKNAAEPERDACKQRLAQKLHDEEGLDLELCNDTVDLLALVLFGAEKKKIYCKNCGKELQEEWKTCPYCTTQTVAVQTPETDKLTSPAISSVSNNGGYGIEQIKPEAAKSSNDTVDIPHIELSNYSSQTQPPKQSATPASSDNTANQETIKYSGVQKFFVFLGSVGGVVASCYFSNGVVNMDKIMSFDSIWGALCGVGIMCSIFNAYNKSKRKKS
ncbi:MAG: zinc ribbon domain-containing protein [Treponema sp.]|jgi:hypothetical protein|nr:zinc ribbon domain-containing protein [Treponema sp.]